MMMTALISWAGVWPSLRTVISHTAGRPEGISPHALLNRRPGLGRYAPVS
jgi:hypothetical protein